MPEGGPMDFAEYDEMMRRLLAIVVHLEHVIDEQQAMNTRVDGYIARQDVINERLTALLERLIHPGGNGQAGRQV